MEWHSRAPPTTPDHVEKGACCLPLALAGSLFRREMLLACLGAGGMCRPLPSLAGVSEQERLLLVDVPLPPTAPALFCYPQHETAACLWSGQDQGLELLDG